MSKVLDPNADYVVVTGGLYAGHTLVASAPVAIVEEPRKPGDLTTEQAQQLYDAGKLQLASEVRPTPVERPEDAVVRLSVLEPMEGGKFLLRAPWLPEGSETVTGDEDKAKARLAAIRDEGLATYEAVRSSAARKNPESADAIAATTLAGGDGFQIVESGSIGYYTIIGPDREPERVRGKKAAETRLAEVRAEVAGGVASLEPTIEPPANPSAGPAPSLTAGGRPDVLPENDPALNGGETDSDVDGENEDDEA
jgi:hypothetical protein